jgi:hypothetical protein
MASAAVLSLEACRDAPPHTEVRHRRRDRFDRWLEPVEEHVKEPTPPLEELTAAVLALRQELTPAVTAGLVAQAHRTALAQRLATGPRCGQLLSARAPQERTVETRGGAIRLRRPSCSCERCQFGPTPVDEALQVSERRQQPAVQRAAGQLTKAVPYETAGERCAELTGLPWSAHTAHEVTQAVAAGLTVVEVAPGREESLAQIASVAEGQPWRPMLVRALDGADGPTRPETATGRGAGRKQTRAKRARWTGQWREAKGVRCSLLVDARSIPGLSWHQVQTDEEAADARRQVNAAGLRPEAEVRLCVMADGAGWIWTQAGPLFPSAVDILDDDHGSAPLDKVAALPYGAQPERQRDGGEGALARLFWGEGHAVIWGLPRRQPTEAQAAPESGQLIRALPRHQARLDSRFARKGGSPMGSGGIASAHQFIGQVRLKRSGAWW